MNGLKALVKKQHDERKAMPEYYHDKLCLFGAWIPEESVDKFNTIIFTVFKKSVKFLLKE